VEQLADVLRSGDAGAFQAPMVKINAEGSRRPLFFFHGDLRGGGLYCAKLARRLGPNQPLYVVHPLGRDGQPMPRTIEAMAAAHLAALREVQPHGPYRIGGYCNGGLVAFEIAQLLVRGGETVERLVLIAAEPDTRLAWVYALARRLAPRVGVSAEMAVDYFGRLRSFISDAEGRPLRQRVALALKRVTASLGDLTGAWGGYPPDTTFTRYFRAVMGYVPRPFAGPIVLFWPSEERSRHDGDPTIGWGRLATSVDVQMVPGNHNTIVTRHIHDLGERLATYL
jgi:thioesterase domain-containing protein